MCCAEISVASHYCGGFIYIDTHAGIDCFQHLLKLSQIYFCVTRHLCWLNESFKLKTNTILHSRMRSKAQLLFRWIVLVGVIWNVRWWWRLNERHNVSLKLNLFFRPGGSFSVLSSSSTWYVEAAGIGQMATKLQQSWNRRYESDTRSRWPARVIEQWGGCLLSIPWNGGVGGGVTWEWITSPVIGRESISSNANIPTATT